MTSIRQALRALRAAPLVSALAVASIGLGIGAVATVYSTASAFTFRPLPQLTRPDRLLVVAETPSSDPVRGEQMSPGAFLDFQATQRAFSGVAAMDSRDANIAGVDVPERVQAARVSARFFTVMGRVPALGRTFTADEDAPGAPRIAILSYGLWQRRFGGDPSLVGRTIRIDGEAWSVAGVMPQGFAFPNGTQLWVPLALGPEARQARRERRLFVLARMADGIASSEATADAAAFGRRLATEQAATNAEWMVRTVPAEQYFGRGPRPFMIAMLGAVAFLLLIACANVANLLLARATARRREIAVRLALGASRRHIVQQLLTESALLATAGGVLGLLLAKWGVAATTAIVPPELRTVISGFDALQVDGHVVAFAAVVTVATALVFGLAPALAAARTDIQDTLKEGGRNAPTSRGVNRVRSALVTGEIALALVLLTGASLMVVSARRLIASDPGFRVDGTLTMGITLPAADYASDSAVTRFWDALDNDVASLPSVKAAAVTTVLPMSWNENRTRVEVEGQPLRRPEDAPALGVRSVSPSFLPAIQVPIVTGRVFNSDDRAGHTDVALVSAAAARKLFGGAEAVGKRIKVRGSRWVEIVGVVGNVRGNVLISDDPLPVLYLPAAQWPSRSMILTVTTAGDPASPTAAIQRRIAVLDARLAAGDVATMRRVVDAAGSPQSATARTMAASAVIALLMAAIGTYGVMAYTVAQRTHEIGVRFALGAQTADVVRLVLRQASLLVGLGLALGVVGALAMGVGLKKVLFETNPADPLTIALTALTLAAIAALATWLPARRAARVDPMVALRHD